MRMAQRCSKGHYRRQNGVGGNALSLQRSALKCRIMRSRSKTPIGVKYFWLAFSLILLVSVLKVWHSHLFVLGETKSENHQILKELQDKELQLKDKEQKIQELEKELQAKKQHEKNLATTTQSRFQIVQVAHAAEVTASGVEQWRELVSKYFPANQVDYALRIMSCESGGNPQSVNWNDAKITGMPSNGLFQINSTQDWSWHDPETNIQRAHEMWSRRGWQPWSCRHRI